MLKRILFTFMTFLFLYSCILVGYRIFEPDNVEENETHFTDIGLDFSSVKDYTLSSGQNSYHYYFFCSPFNNDCKYVEETLVKTVESETGIDMTKLIDYVDVTDLEEKMALYRLSSEWGIPSYPAFVSCHTDSETIFIDNIIAWDVNQPLSVEDIKRWLSDAGFYDYEATDAPIETPTP